MRERPILFNTEMVMALLEGRKTCTRRVLNSHLRYTQMVISQNLGGLKGSALIFHHTNRETFCMFVRHGARVLMGMKKKNIITRLMIIISFCTWHPSIHMPKEAARIWLKVTEVRAEHLQDITEEQAISEGIFIDKYNLDCGYDYVSEFAFFLWNSTIKKSDLDVYGWLANPYVWVIEFERCEKPGKE